MRGERESKNVTVFFNTNTQMQFPLANFIKCVFVESVKHNRFFANFINRNNTISGQKTSIYFTTQFFPGHI